MCQGLLELHVLSHVVLGPLSDVIYLIHLPKINNLLVDLFCRCNKGGLPYKRLGVRIQGKWGAVGGVCLSKWVYWAIKRGEERKEKNPLEN